MTLRALTIQAGSNIIPKHITVPGECCPFGSDSSLNLLVLVVASGAVSLPQVDVACDVLDLRAVDVSFSIINLCLQPFHFLTMVFTFIRYIL